MGNKSGKQKKVNFSPFFSTSGSLHEYQIVRSIGHGSFGDVLEVIRKADNKTYAMKVLAKDQVLASGTAERVVAEEELQRVAGEHPFIVNLRYAFQDTENLFIVLDYVAGGDLFALIQIQKKFSEPRARLYAAEIYLALEFLHSLKVVYRDLKMENVLLDMDGHVRITDFGLAKNLLGGPNLFTSTFCGTKEYMAPEVIQSEKGGYDFSVDWWSFGVLIFAMLEGTYPFVSGDRMVLFNKILKDPIAWPNNPGNPVSDSAVSLITKLLCKDPKQRYGGEKIRHDEFFSSLNWKKVEKREYKPAYVPREAKEKVGFSRTSSFLDHSSSQEHLPVPARKERRKKRRRRSRDEDAVKETRRRQPQKEKSAGDTRHSEDSLDHSRGSASSGNAGGRFSDFDFVAHDADRPVVDYAEPLNCTPKQKSKPRSLALEPMSSADIFARPSPRPTKSPLNFDGSGSGSSAGPAVAVTADRKERCSAFDDRQNVEEPPHTGRLLAPSRVRGRSLSPSKATELSRAHRRSRERRMSHEPSADRPASPAPAAKASTVNEESDEYYSYSSVGSFSLSEGDITPTPTHATPDITYSYDDETTA